MQILFVVDVLEVHHAVLVFAEAVASLWAVFRIGFTVDEGVRERNLDFFGFLILCSKTDTFLIVNTGHVVNSQIESLRIDHHAG
jgi:hypothetical protein